MTADDSHVSAEIRRQPEAWMRALELLPHITAQLPQRGERVAVIGCGTSWYMAMAYAGLREELGDGETDAFAASQFPLSRRYDRVVAISRSGTTTEVVNALTGTTVPSVAITAVPGSPITSAAASAISLDWADEKSIVQTVFATTAFTLLRASLSDPAVEVAIEQARAVLSGGLPIPELPDQVTFLGQGWAYGPALEAALKAREAAQLWTEAYLQMEYRHGPIAVAEADRMIWLLGTAVDGLVQDIAATRAGFVNDDLDPVADLVRAQLAAVQQARRRGLDPDRPRHLTRSVILPEVS